MMDARALVDVVVVASVISALAITPRVLACRSDPVGAAGHRVFSPAAWLALVTGLVYVNQVLFTVYVLRVHAGDPSFVARYLPAGWFDLASANPVLRRLAELFPAPGLLAPSVLRVRRSWNFPSFSWRSRRWCAGWTLACTGGSHARPCCLWHRCRTRPFSALSSGICAIRTLSTMW
ncbi:hypothetical protein ACFY20_35065 [Streptomyces sp. NPDC001312]|uniref:hypothetical protein n=1 Tax=Streptomyces sp. NPDC001312 TaxID=3364561 RepID=UPI0036CA155F